MLKFIELLVSFLLGQSRGETTPSIGSIVHEILPRIRRAVLLTSFALGATALICTGIVVSLLEMAGQYDRDGHVTLTASSSVGFIFIAIGALAAYLGLKSSAWFSVEVQTQAPRQAEHHPSPVVEIVNALTPLVQEYLRSRNQTSAPTQGSAHDPMPESQSGQNPEKK